MSGDNTPIIIALLGLVAAVLVPIFTTRSNEREGRRKERYEYLTKIITSLIEIRGEIQWAQVSVNYSGDERKDNKHFEPAMMKEAFERLQIALGKAHAIMISVDDSQIRQWGKAIMQLNDPSEQNNLIELTLGRLGELYGVLSG